MVEARICEVRTANLPLREMIAIEADRLAAPSHPSAKAGTLNAILKQAGLKNEKLPRDP